MALDAFVTQWGPTKGRVSSVCGSAQVHNLTSETTQDPACLTVNRVTTSHHQHLTKKIWQMILVSASKIIPGSGSTPKRIVDISRKGWWACVLVFVFLLIASASLGQLSALPHFSVIVSPVAKCFKSTPSSWYFGVIPEPSNSNRTLYNSPTSPKST